MPKSAGHPRPIEIRVVADAEPAMLDTWRWRLAIRLLRVAVKLVGWRAKFDQWDSRVPRYGEMCGTKYNCPCWYAERCQEKRPVEAHP